MNKLFETSSEYALAGLNLSLPQVLEAVGQGILIADVHGTIHFINSEARRLVGADHAPIAAAIRKLSSATGEPPASAADVRPGAKDRRAGRELLAQANPSENKRHVLWNSGRCELELSSASLLDGSGAITGLVVRVQEAKARAQASLDSLAYLANHDELTGLVNRRVFMDRLRRVARDPGGACHTLVFMDLDRFKPINDQCGHQAGDRALKQVAALLRAQVRQRDTLARLGGDEFGLLMENCELAQGQQVANALCLAMSSLKIVEGPQAFSLGISIGMVTVTSSLDPELLLAAADNACYRSKASGGSRVTYCRGVSAPRQG